MILPTRQPQDRDRPGASDGLAADVERRRRRAGARLARRAVECEDPELHRLLARAAADARRVPGTAGSGPVLAVPDASRPEGAEAAAAVAAGGAPVVLDRRDVTEDLIVLKVRRPSGFAYRAGQHLKFGVPDLMRTYSLVSAPHEPELEFFIELIPGGRLSGLLKTLPVGAEVALGGRPKGGLRLDAERRNHLMLATVTGIAPYISLLRDHFHQGRTGHRFIVLVGASHADELAYSGELDAIAAEYPDTLVHIPTVSRPEAARNVAWGGTTGRVGAHAPAALGRYGLTPRDTAVYACGHPQMVDDVARQFETRGFSVYTEKYD